MSATTYIDELKAKYPLEYECLSTSFPTQKDLDILLAIDKAYKSICRYCGWTTVPDEYVSATIQLSTVYLNSISNTSKAVLGERIVKQNTEGSRSRSFGDYQTTEIDSDGLTADIKAMLPCPKLRCFA